MLRCCLMNLFPAQMSLITLLLTPDVIRGGDGAVRIALSGDKGKETFYHRPNCIGDNNVDSKFSGISLAFINQKCAKYLLKVRVADSEFPSGEPIDICTDEQCLAFSKEKSVYEFVAFKPMHLYLKSCMYFSYLLFSPSSGRSLSDETLR